VGIVSTSDQVGSALGVAVTTAPRCQPGRPPAQQRAGSQTDGYSAAFLDAAVAVSGGSSSTGCCGSPRRRATAPDAPVDDRELVAFGRAGTTPVEGRHVPRRSRRLLVRAMPLSEQP
jgi:hypothetical protein